MYKVRDDILKIFHCNGVVSSNCHFKIRGDNTRNGVRGLLKTRLSAFFSCPIQSLVKTANVLICISLTIKKNMIENGAVSIHKG